MLKNTIVSGEDDPTRLQTVEDPSESPLMNLGNRRISHKLNQTNQKTTKAAGLLHRRVPPTRNSFVVTSDKNSIESDGKVKER